jgi:5-methylcytosine-specific restriction enzyme A
MCPELRRVARRQREPQSMGPRLLNAVSMAKEFAKKFYKSKAWQRTREAYAASVGQLCEDCLDAGICNIGEIVHHRIEITPDNINNPDITLNWDNLRLVCRDCHAKAHGATKRFKVDAFGRVTARGEPPCSSR